MSPPSEKTEASLEDNELIHQNPSESLLFGHSWGSLRSHCFVRLYLYHRSSSFFILHGHFKPPPAKYLCQATSWHPHNWSSSAAKTFRRHVWWPCSQDVLGGFYLILRLNLARDPRWMGDDSLFTFRRIPKVLQDMRQFLEDWSLTILHRKGM